MSYRIALTPDGWEEKRLGDVATLQRGMDLPIHNRTPGEVPVYGSNGIDGFHSETPLVGPGVITGRSGTIGFVYFCQEKYWPLNTTLYVKDFHRNEPRFVFRLLESLKLDRFTAATGVPSLNRNFVHPTSVHLPPLPEQRRIAKILDTVDEAIRATEQLIAKLKQMKQGLLHDLLTRGIDDNGELRDPERHPEQFKDSSLGRIPRGWDVGHVATEFQVESGLTLGPHRKPQRHPHPYLRVANVHRERLDLSNIAHMEASDSEIVNKSLRHGDLLVVEGHANAQEIGRCAMASEDVDGFTFQNHIFRLRPFRMNNKFVLYYMNCSFVRSYWWRMCSTSSGLYTINKTKLKKLSMLMPSAEEQEAIVAKVDQIERRVLREQSHLAKLKLLKKGLMEDLLTGRVRVNVDEGEAV